LAALSKEMSAVLRGIEKATPRLVRDPITNGKVKWITLDSPQLNFCFGGGFPIGRVIQLYGPFSGGKSSISAYIGGQLQHKMPEGKQTVVYADFERSFDVTFASENGLDCTPIQDGGKLLFLRPDSIEEFVDTCQQLISTGEIALIVLDSEAAAPTKTMMSSEAGKCVAPDTMVNYLVDDVLRIDTIASLFAAAGYEDYSSLEVGRGVVPKTKIQVLSYSLDGSIVMKPVTKLVYKGRIDHGIEASSDAGSFIGTDEHRVFDYTKSLFISLREAAMISDFYSISVSGKKTLLTFKQFNHEFDVLDVEVEDTHSYFTGGVLSHNSNFGSGAKAMSEGLRKLNILLSNYDTGMIVISQERANLQPMSHLPATTGGFALPFYASIRARVTKTDMITDAKGNTIGQKLRVRNYKNKVGVPFRTAENISLYFQGGFNPDEEYLNFLIDLDIVHAKGAWIDAPDYGIHVNGRAKLQEWLNSHPDEYAKMKLAVDDALKGKTKLDENNVDPESQEAQELESLGLKKTDVELEEPPDMSDLDEEV
jgi:RecA/RadA recombinase